MYAYMRTVVRMIYTACVLTCIHRDGWCTKSGVAAHCWWREKSVKRFKEESGGTVQNLRGCGWWGRRGERIGRSEEGCQKRVYHTGVVGNKGG